MATSLVFHPVLKINSFVTMWDTPSSADDNKLGGIAATAATAVLNVAMPFLAGGFRDVEGLNAIAELETYHEGGHNAVEHRYFKQAKYPKLVLKRGVTFNTDIWDWHHQVITGDRKLRKSGTIILLDQTRLFDTPGVEAGLPFEHFPVAAWTFSNALPVQITGPTLNANEGEGENAIAIEALELHPEKIERLSLALVPGMADLNSALGALAGAGASGLVGAAGIGAGIAFG